MVANILANPLIELAPILKHYTAIGGTLMLSGVTRPQTERVMAHYRDTFSFDILYRQEWAPVSYTHLTLPTNREV